MRVSNKAGSKWQRINAIVNRIVRAAPCKGAPGAVASNRVACGGAARALAAQAADSSRARAARSAEAELKGSANQNRRGPVDNEKMLETDVDGKNLRIGY